MRELYNVRMVSIISGRTHLLLRYTLLISFAACFYIYIFFFPTLTLFLLPIWAFLVLFYPSFSLSTVVYVVVPSNSSGSLNNSSVCVCAGKSIVNDFTVWIKWYAQSVWMNRRNELTMIFIACEDEIWTSPSVLTSTIFYSISNRRTLSLNNILREEARAERAYAINRLRHTWNIYICILYTVYL